MLRDPAFWHYLADVSLWTIALGLGWLLWIGGWKLVRMYWELKELRVIAHMAEERRVEEEVRSQANALERERQGILRYRTNYSPYGQDLEDTVNSRIQASALEPIFGWSTPPVESAAQAILAAIADHVAVYHTPSPTPTSTPVVEEPQATLSPGTDHLRRLFGDES